MARNKAEQTGRGARSRTDAIAAKDITKSCRTYYDILCDIEYANLSLQPSEPLTNLVLIMTDPVGLITKHCHSFIDTKVRTS